MSKHEDTFRPPSWSERFARWFVSFLPIWLVNAPERILVNGVMLVIGGFAIVSQPPDSLVSYWSNWWAVEWGLTMVAGGAFTLFGVIKPNISSERFGLLLIAIGALIYGIDVVVTFGLRGIFSGVVYIGIAIAKLIRIAESTALRAEILRSHEES
jgi:hypothetical protein